VQGLIDLYQAGFEVAHLEAALQLAATMIARFEDEDAGGFFVSAAGDGDLVLRLKDDYDGAEPSGNSIAILDCLRLARIAGSAALEGSAARALTAFAGRMEAAPVALPRMFVALEYSRTPPRQIVLAASRREAAPFLREIHRRFLPHTTVLLVDGDATRYALARYASEIEGMRPIEGAAAAYVCENFACRLPVTDPERLGELIETRPARTAGG
jgi:uncharacterized protein